MGTGGQGRKIEERERRLDRWVIKMINHTNVTVAHWPVHWSLFLIDNSTVKNNCYHSDHISIWANSYLPIHETVESHSHSPHIQSLKKTQLLFYWCRSYWDQCHFLKGEFIQNLNSVVIYLLSCCAKALWLSSKECKTKYLKERTNVSLIRVSLIFLK